MKRDLLAEATRALGESAEAPPSQVDATRARVMTTLRKQRAHRTPLVRLLIPLAAVLVGSMAWAASEGRLPTSLRDIVPSLSSSPPSPSVLPSSAPSLAPIPSLANEERALDAPREPGSLSPSMPSTPERESVSPPSVAATDAVTRGAAKSIGAPTPEHRAARSIPSVHTAPAQIPAPSVTTTPTDLAAEKPATTTPSEPDEQALYTAAHRHHFVERNPGAALAAWDTYLRAAPRGRLAVEARYNRALCLVRLGRTAEAEAALEGFARGAYGGYRRTEAQALLDAMRGAAR